MASTSTKPSLSLSVSSAASPHNTPSGRRIASWGSAVSETGSLGGYDDRRMTPLPSPSGTRDWGFFPPSSSERDGGWGSLGRNSSLRGRSSSIFEEMRDPDVSGGYSSGAGGGWSDGGKSEQSEDARRSPPSKSKTLSFFDSDDSTALSPPPNPPSRGNSLKGHRSTPSTESAVKSSASSSGGGGSWLDRVDAATAGAVWSRASGASAEIGTTSLSSTPPRRLSPERHSHLPHSPSSPSTKPLLHALQTTSLRYVPKTGSDSPAPASSRPMTSLPTPSEAHQPSGRGARFLAFNEGALPGAHHSLAPRPPPIDLSTIPDRPPSAQSGTQTPVTPSMDDPPPLAEDLADEEGAPQKGDLVGEYRVEKLLGKGAFSRVALARLARGKPNQPGGELVALKMITNKSYDGNERMRISVVREVEVLKNIRHPSLISISASFSTPIYTVLVLDYAPGGELFDFLAQWHPSVEEPLARRIFGELCSAVGWMHSIGLVHRDIKLENILLTSRPFPSSTPAGVLASLRTPFVKLTDFGLSRFISPTNPILSTRCGSEAYAAPELIMGRKYDGRKTDAWALGVVLFAIITGVMPFVEDTEGAKGRRGYLLKIAKSEYRWPSPPRPRDDPPPSTDTTPTKSPPTTPPPPSDLDATRLVTPSVKALAARLLVRDPEKRAKVDDVWESEWMYGEGRPERVDGFVEPVRDGSPDLRATWVRRGSGL